MKSALILYFVVSKCWAAWHYGIENDNGRKAPCLAISNSHGLWVVLHSIPDPKGCGDRHCTPRPIPASTPLDKSGPLLKFKSKDIKVEEVFRATSDSCLPKNVKPAAVKHYHYEDGDTEYTVTWTLKYEKGTDSMGDDVDLPRIHWTFKVGLNLDELTLDNPAAQQVV